MNKFIQIAISEAASGERHTGCLIALDSNGDIYKLDIRGGWENNEWDKMPDHPNALVDKLKYDAEHQARKRRVLLLQEGFLDK